MQPFAVAVVLTAALVSGQALADKLPLPKASYSADIVFEANGHQYTGRINVDGYKERRDVKDSAGQGTVKIIRRDLGKLFELRPQRRTALELRISAAEAAGETGAPATDIDSFYGADAIPQGHEVVAGLQTTKYRVNAETTPGLKIDTLVWSTDDGIIVRVVGKATVDGGDQSGRIELTNISRGPQDPNLFEIPQGTTVISPDTPVDGADTTPAAKTGSSDGAAAKAPAADPKDSKD
jgi:hypothetical protein